MSVLIFNKIAYYLIRQIGQFLPDSLYLKILYWKRLGMRLNLNNPQTFNEKLQWLKLYDRKSEYTIMVDKCAVKKYVAQIIGDEYIIPTLGVWNKPEDIEWDNLPNQFVLKCNHNSGTGMYICKDKGKMDIEKVKTGLKKGLKENYYALYREWPYKNVPRCIIAEKYMVDNDSESSCLTDYKFFCFNGEPFMMYVSHDNAKNATTDFFDMNYNRLSIRMKDPNSEIPPAKPKEFDQMKKLAKKLSKGCPHVRIDFYIINHNIYFGEMTFFHNAGLGPVMPEEWNIKLGQMIALPHSKPEV